MAAQALSADVLIVGGGPTGLAAALALSRQLYRAIVFDSGTYRNSISQHMHTVPTWDHKDVKDYRAAARKELTDRYKTTTFIDQAVKKLSKQSDTIFEALDATGRKWTGKKIILASGVQDIMLDIKGYEKCWGNSIFHCLFCHGYEERGHPRAGLLAVEMMANKQFALGVACMAKSLAGSVTMFTHGNDELARELQQDADKHNLKIDTRRIFQFEKVSEDSATLKVHFDDGSPTEELGFLAHTPRTRLATPWAEQLGLETTETGEYRTTPPFQTTSVPGVFAAGDCGSPMKAVPLGLSAGMLAAAGCAHQISQGA